MTTVHTVPAGPSTPLWLLVAFKPKTAFRELQARGEGYPWIRLSVLAFLALALGTSEVNAARTAMARFGPLGLLAALGIAACACAAIVAVFWAFSWFAAMSGRLVGGSGSVKDVRGALAWGLTPWIWSLVFRIPAMVFWPAAAAAVYESRENSSIRVGDHIVFGGGVVGDAPLWQIFTLGILELAVFIWAMVVQCRTLSEAQGISPWKALANLLLAFILPAAAMIVAFVAALVAQD